jgi:hypothetical protein
MERIHVLGVYDEAGRYLGPADVAIQVRPMGPWDTNAAVAAPLVVICAWCPDFDRTAPANANATHGICPRCVARVELQEAA